MGNQEQIQAAFLIADLAGYTALTDSHGDSAAVEVIDRYLEIVNNSLRDNTKLLERVGDEVLIQSESVDNILETGVHIVEAINSENHFPSVHAGMHYGNIIRKSESYYGSTLNITSRIAGYARAGQLLCSKAVIDQIHSLENYKFYSVGEVSLKNLFEPLELFEIQLETDLIERVFDPVCHMQLTKESAPAKLPYNEKSYYFCSYKCVELFIDNPEYYLEAEQ